MPLSSRSHAKLPKARIHFRSWPEFAEFLTQEGGAGGLFVRMQQPPAAGAELRLQLIFPDLSELTLRVRVVWRVTAAESKGDETAVGMAVQLTDMSAEQAEQLQFLMAHADVARGLAEVRGRSLPPPSGSALRARPRKPPGDRRLYDVYALLDCGRFDAAERAVGELMRTAPSEDAHVLLLLIQARRMSSQFDFDGALSHYEAALAIRPGHEEALEQVRRIHAELVHSAALFRRVFGSTGD